MITRRRPAAFVLFSLLFACMLAGCLGVQAPKPPAPKAPALSDYFPAVVGSVWDFEGHGNEYASYVRTVVHRSGEKTQIEVNNGGTVTGEVYRIAANEVRQVYFMGEFYTRESLLDAKENRQDVVLKAPLEPGQKWESSKTTKTIEQVGLEVTVPAGTFKQVVKVLSVQKKSNWRSYEYYAPDVGPIKYEHTDGTNTISSLLKSYKPAK
ncbi:MAG: hypothetical protein Q8P50_11120 [Bacillota bacterium]|nr:hypothetical protein [Bacillota bacterium]